MRGLTNGRIILKTLSEEVKTCRSMNTQNLQNFIGSVDRKLERGNRVKVAVHSLRRYLEIGCEESAAELSKKLQPFIESLDWRIFRTNWGFSLVFEKAPRRNGTFRLSPQELAGQCAALGALPGERNCESTRS